jgi:hypothetical protein
LAASKKKIEMRLKRIFEDKLFGKFREKEISQIERNQIIAMLSESKGIVWFKPFMQVRETLPNELLEAILISGIRYEDVSYPKRWMPDVIRIYSQEQIDETLFEIIRKSSFRDKCRLTSLFSWNKFKKTIIHIDGNQDEEVGVNWKWNGEIYIEEYLKSNLEEIQKRDKVLKFKRYDFLISEFGKHENLVYRYFISLELPKSLEEFPDQLKDTAKEVVEVVSNKNFPTCANALIEQVKGNKELENLLFKELRWRKK